MRDSGLARLRVLLVASGALLGGVVVVLAAGVWTPLPERVTRGATGVEGPVDTVEIGLDHGTLVVVGTAVDAVEIDHESVWRGWRPTVTVDVADGTATVLADCPWRPLLGSCSTDLYVRVPEGVHLRIHVGHGPTDLRGLRGWVELSIDGGLTATDMASPELLATSSGGDIAVTFLEPPSRVDLDSGGGDVVLEIPGGPYEAAVTGDPVDIEVPVEELAERLLEVDGGRGAVTIRRPDG